MIPWFKCRNCGWVFAGSKIFSRRVPKVLHQSRPASYIQAYGNQPFYHHCDNKSVGVADLIAITPNRKPPLSRRTMERIHEGMRKYGITTPYIVSLEPLP